MLNVKLGTIVFPILIAAVGCASESAPSPGEASDVLQHEQAFVPISRTLSRDLSVRANALSGLGTQAVPSANAKESFYLAINKKELNRRYFLSAYMKQAYPGSVGAGAAASLGTRVVTFREQNGKLFVFDAQDGRASSDTFDPALIIEAYPVVDHYSPFLGLAGHDDYVLFDPAAGLNRFGVVSDLYAHGDLSSIYGAGSQPLHFQVDLSYLQNFRRINDGSTFEQVFTGAVNEPVPENQAAPSNPANPFTASGTLGIALRRYSEGEGFTLFDANSTSQEYYFRADPLLEKNTGGTLSRATKWNIRPGMKPIKWVISEQFVEVGRQNPKYDIVGAIKAGIENWNAVFGFKAFEAQIATAQDSYADDDKNYFIYDGDPTYSYAFANWRLNPNTGEIRGASVYFNAIWLQAAIDEFDPQASSAARTSKPQTRAPVSRITWAGLRGTPLCTLFAPNAGASHDDLERSSTHARAVNGVQQVEQFITHVAVHEVGHTLGLRHNFKGSLLPLPQQSSVMEYILDPDAVEANRNLPGPYDYDAIRLLYGLQTNEPSQPFCTDEATELDPACATFDRTEDPLAKFYGSGYNARLNLILRNQDPTGAYFNSINRRYLNGTAAYLRAGTAADQGRAWSELDKLLALGRDHTADNAQYPGYTDRLSDFQNYVLNRLFLDPAHLRGDITKDPSLTGTTLTTLTTTLQGVITNSDTYRGWNTRRTAVDVLKKLQAQPAYQALLNARATLANATLPPGSTEAALRDDLVARIDSATHPYFK
ncbi:zinc-dependent metalloprotease [Pendulispora albinea]|uniref:Zinc-dependent metalloprotease n=1 Tax=Pendulispora albinea TaxID=2741071 RepID=A0ABZ2LY07_9BACT